MTRDDIIGLALAGKQSLRDRISWAVDMEREACAKVCDELVLEHPGRADLTAKQCAFVIRERGAP